MGLFGKKKTKKASSENDEKIILEENLRLEIQSLQNDFVAKQEDLKNISEKIKTVKEEYDISIGSLMSIKKELHQKKMELDTLQREHKEINEKIKGSIQVLDSKEFKDFNKTKDDLVKIKQELDEYIAEHDTIKKKIVQEQYTLRSIKQQQAESQKDLDTANSRLYNAKEELGKKDIFQEEKVLTQNEEKFIQGDNQNKKDSAGIIEAASAVVGSLKSKLNMAQKELEAIQLLLEKERSEHENAKRELERLRAKTKSLG